MSSNAMTSIAGTPTYAIAAARSSVNTTSPKYVPVHKRTPSDATLVLNRSPSPALSESSTTTTSSSSSHSRVYSIAELLHLSHEPEVKLISVEQRDILKDVLPEIVMNRKMRKAMEYHAIQERVQAQAQQALVQPQPVAVLPKISTSPVVQQRQRPGQRRQVRTVGTERRRNASKVVDEVSWRSLRSPRVATQPIVAISAA